MGNDMDDMDIDNLTVIHRIKDAAGHGLTPKHESELREKGLYLNTCLRQLVILDSTGRGPALRVTDPELQWFSGNAAYSFLLQTATGLNSSIPGETNILGQFQHAWRSWRAQKSSPQASRLDATMRRLFADSRDVRREYLQGIGGNSYGSLVRKLLAPETSARILFVGTGKLADSMRPLFDMYDVAFWNYRSGCEILENELRIFSVDEPQLAAAWATHIVLTTPAEAASDSLWAQLAGNEQTVVHLGRRRAEPGAWAKNIASGQYFDLDDVFELRSRQSTVRSLQIRRARKACEQLANAGAIDSQFALPRKASA
jgi:Glutamyl-tRNAGlu reductase, N-terminal domain